LIEGAVQSESILFRPFETPADAAAQSFRTRKLRHPIFSWLGFRPIFAQHTRAEHEALLKWAVGRRQIVEIGVAEGASACALREAMPEDGVLTLIDPYHLSRFRSLNALQRAAHSAVRKFGSSRTVWIQKFSHQAAREWNSPIDLLFIDGDHDLSAVHQDWNEWSRFVVPGGLAIFHDARVFENGWPTPDYGPVRAVNELFRNGKSIGWRIVDEVDSLVVLERAK
jgi:predicted O-methyltransferase YrrM